MSEPNNVGVYDLRAPRQPSVQDHASPPDAMTGLFDPSPLQTRIRAPASAIVATAAAALALASCGGSTKSTSNTATPASTAASTTTTVSVGGALSVSTGPVHSTLRGANHAPTVNRGWAYTVTATDAAGHRLSGTVDIEFVFEGQVVGRDTPPTHPITNGRWHDTLMFPADAVGEPLTFQAVVHTHLGSITLDWPIKVMK